MEEKEQTLDLHSQFVKAANSLSSFYKTTVHLESRVRKDLAQKLTKHFDRKALVKVEDILFFLEDEAEIKKRFAEFSFSPGNVDEKNEDTRKEIMPFPVLNKNGNYYCGSKRSFHTLEAQNLNHCFASQPKFPGIEEESDQNNSR